MSDPRLCQIFSCIDNTTLEGADTQQKVTQLCLDSVAMQNPASGIPHVAAVCVYPTFVNLAKTKLAGSGIHVASVAGAFPAGQSPLEVKLAEVQYAVQQGADEIDTVISRGALIEGDAQRVFDELYAIRHACPSQILKVILETGELPSPTLIAQASDIAISAGADFIKTSTGKISVSATPESARIMLSRIAEHYKKTGKLVGFKAAGGISTPEQALLYFQLVEEILGPEYTNKQYFRIGASRLTNRLFQLLT